MENHHVQLEEGVLKTCTTDEVLSFEAELEDIWGVLSLFKSTIEAELQKHERADILS